MAIAASIDVIITANTTRLEKGLSRATSAVQGFQSSITRWLTGALSFAAAYATVRMIFTEFAETFEELNDLAIKSQALGISGGTLAALRMQAQDAELSIEQLDTALAMLAKRTDDTVTPLGEQFRNAAERIQNAGSQVEKIQIATQLFGRSGAALIPILDQGAEGFDQAQQMAEKLGLSLSDIDIANITAMDNEIDALTNAWKGLERQVVLSTIPTLTDALRAFNEAPAVTRETFGKGGITDMLGAPFKQLEGFLMRFAVNREMRKLNLPTGVSDTLKKPLAEIDEITDEMIRKGERLTEEFRPAEKLKKGLDELNELFRKNLIEKDVLEGASKELIDEFNETMKKLKKLASPGDFLGIGGIGDALGKGIFDGITSGVNAAEGVAEWVQGLISSNVEQLEHLEAPGAVEAGSMEAFSLIAGMQRSEQQQQLELQRQGNAMLTKMFDLWNKYKPTELLALGLK